MSKVTQIFKHWSPMQTEKSLPSCDTPENEIYQVPALSVYPRVRISRSAPETKKETPHVAVSDLGLLSFPISTRLIGHKELMG